MRVLSALQMRFCVIKGCNKFAHYDYLGEEAVRFCGAHKLENMYQIRGLCVFKGCTVNRNYNYPGQPRRFCFAHKNDPKDPDSRDFVESVSVLTSSARLCSMFL
jgi:hypothetical protein